MASTRLCSATGQGRPVNRQVGDLPHSARRKPIAVVGYLVTALGTAAFGLATSAWHVLLARAAAWFGRGVRTPVRKALLAGSVTPETYGRAFGFERMTQTPQ